jgi:hypothetical protein
MSILIIKSGTTSISGGTVKGDFTYFSATTKGLGATVDTGFWSGVDPTCDGYTIYQIGGQHGWAAMVATGREQLNYYLKLFGGTGTTTDENVTWATNSNNMFIHTGSTGPCPTPTPTPTNTCTPFINNIVISNGSYTATNGTYTRNSPSEIFTQVGGTGVIFFGGDAWYLNAGVFGNVARNTSTLGTGTWVAWAPGNSSGIIADYNYYYCVTPTPTNDTTPTPTPTPTSTPVGIQATIAFSFFGDGFGLVSAKMEVTNGVTIDSLSWGGNGIGYSSLGCSGTESTQSFNDVLGVGAPQITTEVWNNSSILSAQNQTGSFTVNGQTINNVSQIITVGGHSYLITGVTDCFSPLT